MEKILKILVILMVLSGCKTIKKATESTVSTSNERAELNTSVTEKKDLNVQKAVSTDMETTTEETITEFYAPGSTGSSSSPQTSVSGSMNDSNKGAIKSIKTTKTTTRTKEADNSKIEDKGQKQENIQQKKEGETETQVKNSEVVKKGISTWKVVVTCIALGSGVVLYVLIRKKVIEIPLLTRMMKWMKSLF